MDMVADGIWIGGRRDALDHAELQRVGIEAVLQLYGPEPEPLAFPFARATRCVFVVDGEPIPPDALREGVQFIAGQRSLGRPMLVTCGAGQSRSPAFVAAYLHEQGMELQGAFTTLIQRRPQILPHPELLRSLVGTYQLSAPAEAILVALVRKRRELQRVDP
jgi:dual specificity protein phosphatase-like protein